MRALTMTMPSELQGRSMTVPELDLLHELLDDAHLNELLFNGHDRAFAERDGKLQLIPSPFESEADFEATLAVITALPNTVSIGRLQFDGMLPNGSRFHVTRPPHSPHHSTLSVRKFMPKRRGLESLVEAGALTKKVAQFLEACVNAR